MSCVYKDLWSLLFLVWNCIGIVFQILLSIANLQITIFANWTELYYYCNNNQFAKHVARYHTVWTVESTKRPLLDAYFPTSVDLFDYKVPYSLPYRLLCSTFDFASWGNSLRAISSVCLFGNSNVIMQSYELRYRYLVI